ncbi:MAG TPA: cupredoxin domain-containing protein [Casimicrobiaceae bacterium]|nr:cupredoxin domain-containing protein [Casimicrobiaceae bacterium]
MKLVAALSVSAALVALPVLAEDMPSFTLSAKNGRFEPTVIEVPAGKKFKLEVSNEGKSAIEFESKDLRQEKVVPPGKKATLTINALKAGEYKFFDEYHEATAQGKVVAK